MNCQKIILFLMSVLLAGAASRASEAQAKPTIEKIAILPVKELTEVTLQNKSGVQLFTVVATAALAVDNHSKQRTFSEQVIAQNVPMGKDLTAYLQQALEKEGYRVVLLDDIKGEAGDSKSVDIEEVDTDADAILQVRFDEVGLLSDSFSNSYIPRANIQATLYSPQLKDDLYDETLYYGVDARAGKPRSIVADPAFSYPSFDNVMARIPEVTAAFATGTNALGERLIAEIKKALQ